MKQRVGVIALVTLTVVPVIFSRSLFAASAPANIVVTYGGLNEWSGVLFVAKDAGIFQKHGLDAQVVNVRSGAVGLSALAAGETQFHGGSATGASIGAMAGWLAVLMWHHRSSGRLNGALLREAAHRSAADVLQRSLLPDRLPSVEGVQLAGRSLPGELGHHVGGDWYDVITLPTGELGLVVGDVVGHDLAAATAMGQLRNALRAYALDDSSPARVLTRLNRAADLLDVVELATCIYAILDPRTLAVRWSSAGHLAPLVSAESGIGELAAVDPGPPLGAIQEPEYVDSVLHLRRGDALVLYTDGLVERRGEAIDAGLDNLASIRGPHPSADAMCDLLVSTLLGDRPRGDDVTLLVVQTVAEARSVTA